MLEEYLILQRKDLGEDSVIAIPQRQYHPEIDKVFDKSGVMQGISKNDFQKHNHFGHNYLPIEILGRISEPSLEASEELRKGIAAICQKNVNFDKERILGDKNIRAMFFDYEMVSKDIYVVRFSGRELKEDKEFHRSIAYFVDSNGWQITTEGNNILLNGQQIELPDGDMKFALGHSRIDGSLEAFRAGSAKLHRKVLKPYISHGTYGSPHSNGPWIIHEEDLSMEKINFMSKILKF